MKNNISFQTRREFLRSTLLGGSLSWTVPAFLADTFSALHAEAAEKQTQVATGKDANILIVLQMAGGNDGLNTVVPYNNDYYTRARSRLAVPEKEVLKVNDQLGFHPSLSGLKEIYDAGQLAVIQGVGYPNPNRSHFRSTEIWQTASDSDKSAAYGWLGRYFDNTCSGCDPTIAINVGRQMSLALASKHPKGVSLDNPQNYRFITHERSENGEMSTAEESFRKLNQLDPETNENAGGTIAALNGTVRHSSSALDFLERTALDAQVSSDQIRSIAARAENKASYPASQLGNSLKLVARLIGGGMSTRIFYVSQGGYDTHTNQTATHQRLLKELGDALKAFVDDMKTRGNMERVLLMTFSEFGRRLAENASGGTDHGAAAPMFLIGSRLKAGLFGQQPSLAPADLFQGDIKYKIDFRSVYATVLESWFHTKSEPILGRSFPLLPVI